MRRYLFLIDAVSTWVGKSFAWLIILLTATTSFDVLMRYLFRSPTLWAYDVSYMLYGTIFMMGGAYALAQNRHVRGDMLYRLWPVRVQASLDLVLYLLFFFPGMVALIWAGWEFAELARSFNEKSSASPGGPIIWPYKYVIPIAGFFLFIQGIAEVIRCAQAIKSGVWPPRLHDVQEEGEAV